MAPQHRPRVLVVAEAANPDLTSVSLIGFSLSQALREVCDVHLATELRNAKSIARAGVPDSDYTAIDNRFAQNAAFRVSKRLGGSKGVGWTTYSALSTAAYPVFEWRLWKTFERRLRAGEFDLVHRVTPLSPTVPSLLAGRLRAIGVPFVLGPLNGGIPWPKGFNDVRRKEREWLSYVRNAYKLMPGINSTRSAAAAVVLASRHTYAEVVGDDPELSDKAFYIPENGIDPARFGALRDPTSQSDSGPMRAAFVGRLVPYKGADMLIEASAELVREGRLSLDIIGDGPEMQRLQALVDEKGMRAGVEFPGWVDHGSLQTRLRRSQLFAFPSVREFGGGVVLEAMALGLAPIVTDHGGPPELVPEGCGVVIPLGSRTQLINGYRQTLSELVSTPGRVRQMGDSSREFVMARFTWQAKANQLLEVYDWILGRRVRKPSWGKPFEKSAEITEP